MDNLSNSSPVPNSRLFIETFPLYLPIAFSDKEKIVDLFYTPIRQIEVYCPNCKKNQLFNKNSYVGEVDELRRRMDHEGLLKLDYCCVEHDCKCHKTYFVHVEPQNDEIVFTKCGEYPSLSPRVDQAILDVFPDDADLLEKAVRCLKDGLGVGAYAYLRQVLESHIGLLITEIEKMAQEQEDTETLEKLAKLRGNGQMSKNIDLAKNALPVYLRVKGFNPLGLLYRTLSEGIHNQSDEECLKKANDIYNALTFILSTLANFSDAQNRYKDSLKSLSRKENVSAAEIESKNRDDKK